MAERPDSAERGPREKPEVFYVLRHLNGRYVAQEMASGGYPYLVDGLRRAATYDSFEQAFRYKGVFSRNQFESDSWRIVRCEVTETVISMRRFLNEASAADISGSSRPDGDGPA